MILSDYVELTISNNGKYWRELGYGRCLQRDKITVQVKHLPPNSNKKVLCQCDECPKGWMQQYQIAFKNFGKIHRCYSCNRKYIGSIVDQTKQSAKNSQRSGPLHPRWNPNKRDYLRYMRRVRWLSEKEYALYIDWLNPNRLPRRLCGTKFGYQLDHKLSIKRAYDLGLSEEMVSKYHNLQMLPWENNRQKAI